MEKGKKLLVKADTDFGTVLELQEIDGMILWDPDSFKRLTTAELNKLSKPNRDAYQVVRALAEERQKQSDVDELVAESFLVGKVAARATDRLAVTTTKKGVVTRWERPDMLEVRKSQGWRMAKTGHQTMSGNGTAGDGYHRIGAMGQEELVLIEIDEKNHRRLVQDKRQRRQRALSGINNDVKQQLRNLGSQAAGEALDIVEDADSGDGPAFKAISQEGGN